MTKIKKANLTIIIIAGIAAVNIFSNPLPAKASAITAENIIIATNQTRAQKNIPPLTANQLLTQAAYQKAFFIFQTQKFQHNFGARRFSAWIRETGYQYDYVGENLAIYFQTTESIIKAWLASPLHRKNLLNPRFAEIGVAVVKGKFKGYPAILVVQIFGQPATFPQTAAIRTNQKLNKTPHPSVLSSQLNLNTAKFLNYSTTPNTIFVQYNPLPFDSLKSFFFIYTLGTFCLFWIGNEINKENEVKLQVPELTSA